MGKCRLFYLDLLGQSKLSVQRALAMHGCLEMLVIR